MLIGRGKPGWRNNEVFHSQGLVQTGSGNWLGFKSEKSLHSKKLNFIFTFRVWELPSMKGGPVNFLITNNAMIVFEVPTVWGISLAGYGARDGSTSSAVTSSYSFSSSSKSYSYSSSLGFVCISIGSTGVDSPRGSSQNQPTHLHRPTPHLLPRGQRTFRISKEILCPSSWMKNPRKKWAQRARSFKKFVRDNIWYFTQKRLLYQTLLCNM